jgi:hypothetical protein
MPGMQFTLGNRKGKVTDFKEKSSLQKERWINGN